MKTHLEPREHPEWLQREIDAIHAEHRRAVRVRAAILVVYLSVLTAGILAIANRVL